MIANPTETTPQPFASSADLARSLLSIAHPQRLEILKRLAAGPAGASDVASALGLQPATARRHLRGLAGAGLVRAYPASEGEMFTLNDQLLALLNGSLVHHFSRAATGPAARARPADAVNVLTLDVPAPPDTCLTCQNSNFVRAVLADLDRVLAEARRYHGRLQQMSSQVLSAHEGERRRIARELHDDTAQSLTSILVRLRLLERSVDDPAIRQNVEELRELTASALDSVRRMALDLRPSALDDLGLSAALNSYAEKFSQRWPIQVRFSTRGIRRRLPLETELVLYRVAQEALSNVAKHSSARSAEVSLSRKSGIVTLKIHDDGRGFDTDDISPEDGRGLGLFGMKERVALVGGSLEIESAPHAGTSIVARVPVRASNHHNSGSHLD